MNEKECKCFIRNAVIEHYKSWLSFDGIMTKRVAANNGKLNGPLVREIARSYGVARGIAKNDKNADGIAKAINGLVRNFRGLKFSDKLGKCIGVVKKMEEDGFTNVKLFSGTTKLLWFVAPDNWTMCDSYTKKALGTNDPTKFYEKLTKNGFECLAGEINETLEGTEFKEIYGERIIDKYLWYCGVLEIEFDKHNCFMTNNRLFMDLLPMDLQEKLEKASETIADDHVDAFQALIK